MFDKEIFRHFTNELWDKVQSFFLLKQEAYNGILVEQSWKTVACVQGNTEIPLPPLENVEEISVEMYHADGTIVHQATVRVDNLLYESTNTTHREILLDSIHNSQTYVTYNMETNSISPSYCEGEEVSDLVTTTVRVKQTLQTGTTNLIASRIKYNGENSGLESDNVQEAIDKLDNSMDNVSSSLNTHLNSKSNPHGVTKEQVGLGKVPNVTTNDQTPTYAIVSSDMTLASGEKLSTAFGKIARAINSLKIHLADKSNPHNVTQSQIGLGNVDNTSDTNKPVSRYQQEALEELHGILIDDVNSHLLVKSFDVSISTLGAAGGTSAAYGTFDTDISTSGYTPVGVIGFNTNGTNGTSITYGEMYISGSKLYVLARNTNTAKDCDSTSKVSVQVLYSKNLQ